MASRGGLTSGGFRGGQRFLAVISLRGRNFLAVVVVVLVAVEGEADVGEGAQFAGQHGFGQGNPAHLEGVSQAEGTAHADTVDSKREGWESDDT